MLMRRLLCSSASHVDHVSSAAHARAAARPKLRLAIGGCLVPDSGKQGTQFSQGEDAFFIVPGRAFGVADGVGWWSLKKIDAGKYSRALMKAARDHFALDALRTDTIGAMAEAEKLAERFTGTATFCTVALRPDHGDIEGAILGDSGFMVIRNDMIDSSSRMRDPCNEQTCAKAMVSQSTGRWKVVYKSQEQQIRFNMPAAMGTDSALSSRSAVTVNIPVRKGDIVIGATDGLFDNLYVNDILQIITRALQQKCLVDCRRIAPEDQAAEADRLANVLVEAALNAAKHPTKRGPFAAQSEKVGYKFEGGKMDDVTCVVAIVGCDQV